MKKTLTYILLTSSLAFLTLFCVFTFFIPNCIENSYDIINKKIATDGNIIINTTESVSEGFKNIAGEEVDSSKLTVLEYKYTANKVIGVIQNNTNLRIEEDILATVVLTDTKGILKDVISEDLIGFGSLKPKEQAYFYTENLELDIEEGDIIKIKLSRGSMSDF